MLKAYLSGDPYLSFAVMAGAAPPDATKETHAEVRERFKACALAVQYGMGATSLSQRIRQYECRKVLTEVIAIRTIKPIINFGLWILQINAAAFMNIFAGDQW